MAPRACIRDVGRAMSYSYAEVDAIAKMIPTMLGITIDKALEINPELKKAYESDDRVKNLIDIAKRFNVRVEDLDGDEYPQIIKNDPVTVDGDKVEEIIRLFLTLPADAQNRVISYLRFEHSQL